jgi:hypothetical protein
MAFVGPTPAEIKLQQQQMLIQAIQAFMNRRRQNKENEQAQSNWESEQGWQQDIAQQKVDVDRSEAADRKAYYNRPAEPGSDEKNFEFYKRMFPGMSSEGIWSKMQEDRRAPKTPRLTPPEIEANANAQAKGAGTGKYAVKDTSAKEEAGQKKTITSIHSRYNKSIMDINKTYDTQLASARRSMMPEALPAASQEIESNRKRALEKNESLRKQEIQSLSGPSTATTERSEIEEFMKKHPEVPVDQVMKLYERWKKENARK